MKLYKIIDESLGRGTTVAYLYYYEKSMKFSVEISPDIEEGDLPVFFSSMARKGIRSINNEWSARWVKERIVPEDRQNLGSILRENKLKSYDPARLIAISCGRCAQDDCCIAEADMSDIPGWLHERQRLKLSAVIPLNGCRVLACFKDESVWAVDLKERIKDDRQLMVLEKKRELFETVRAEPGGNAICWEEWMYIEGSELRRIGKKLNLSAEDVRIMTETEIIDTDSACKILGCTRQYIDKLVRTGVLIPVRNSGRTRMYHRSDVQRLTW